MVAAGRIPAHKQGAEWVIQKPVTPKSRRALSESSWQHLIKALKQRSLEGLSGHDRGRTATRIWQLRNSENPSQLLADWHPVNASQDVFSDSLVNQAKQGNNIYLKFALTKPVEYLRSSKDLANVVSSERTIQGMSRQQLATAAKVDEGLVRDIELRRPLSSPSSVRRVLRVLEIEPTALPDLALK